MYALNIASIIKKMTVNELRKFIFENYCKRIEFVKESSYYSKKRSKKKRFFFACNQISSKNS